MRKLDLTGKRFGWLVVIREAKKGKSGRVKWLCKCDCGKVKAIDRNNLKAGQYSCGCSLKHSSITHGMCRTPTYSIWCGMINRCTNPNFKGYNLYGGRGIKVCKRWRHSFKNFLNDMGIRPDGLSLDRFPNVNGDYKPSNCRWANSQQQQGNRRNNVWHEYNGKRMIQSDWARYLKVDLGLLEGQIKRKGSFTGAIKFIIKKYKVKI